MSENEQKAGCVDDAVRQAWCAAITLANNICVQESDRHNDNDEIEGANTGSECAKRIREYVDLSDAHLIELLTEAGATAALEAAALSPARSGEAVRDALVGVVNWYAEEEGNRFVTPPAICAALDALKAAPRNESSGVSPGGGKWDGKTYDRCLACGRASKEPCGGLDGNGLGCTNLHPATPAPQDSVRVGDSLAIERDVLQELADRIQAQHKPTTPAPAAGADGEARTGDEALDELVRMWRLAADSATDPAEHNTFAGCADELSRVTADTLARAKQAEAQCAMLRDMLAYRKDHERDVENALKHVGVELLYRDDGELAKARNLGAEKAEATGQKAWGFYLDAAQKLEALERGITYTGSAGEPAECMWITPTRNGPSFTFSAKVYKLPPGRYLLLAALSDGAGQSAGGGAK